MNLNLIGSFKSIVLLKMTPLKKYIGDFLNN